MVLATVHFQGSISGYFDRQTLPSEANPHFGLGPTDDLLPRCVLADVSSCVSLHKASHLFLQTGWFKFPSS